MALADRRTLGARRTASIRDRVTDAAGGRLRGRILLLLACVLALDTADTSMIGAIAGKLETALQLSNTELGLLASVPSLFAAVATIPIGVLTDRVTRVRLIAVGALVWSIAMTCSGLSVSFEMLLLTRLALGMATATAGPTMSSLVGDYFPARERARIYGLILSGELIGAGVGFVLSGLLASLLSWRAPFFALAVPSLVLAGAVWRLLPEPTRGGRSRDDGEEPEKTMAQRKVDEQNVPPDPDLVLRGDPTRMTLWKAARYVLRVRTNVILIIASALGYFYFTGVQTFGLVLFSGRYDVSRAAATLLLGILGAGALVGVVAGGRLADRLVQRGKVNGRIIVGGMSYMLAAAAFLVALLGHSLWFSMPFYIGAGAAFAARNPALDAARLDVMHHALWGRAEAVRTLLRRVVVATAPLLFGVLADVLASSRAHSSTQHGFGANASVQGLWWAFLLLLATLALSGLLTLRALRTYPRDVATAVASEDATRP
jgi:predicted MFS family arabinose efflux permease